MESLRGSNIHFVKMPSEKEVQLFQFVKEMAASERHGILTTSLICSSDHSSPLGLRTVLVFYCLLPCGSGCYGNHHFGVLMVSTSDSLWGKVQ